MKWCKLLMFIGIGVLLIAGPSSLGFAQELAKEQLAVYGNPAGDIGTIDPQGAITGK